jgi:serine O-acetyltransferase
MFAGKLWLWSCLAYRKDWVLIARLLKAINFVLCHNLLPYEAEIGQDMVLYHYGLGVVVHPNVTIGDRVKIFQHVTIATTSWIGSESRVYIGSDVMIGAGAVIVSRENQSLYIGDRAKIGANAVVTKDVPADTTVVGVPARPIHLAVS